jgi:hypothetical protein
MRDAGCGAVFISNEGLLIKIKVSCNNDSGHFLNEQQFCFEI